MRKTDQTNPSLFRSVFLMSLATSISRITGLVREMLMAAFFGASGLTDAFLVAYRIPNLLRDLLAEGAFSSSFVPTFTEENQKSFKHAQELLNSLIFLLGGITFILSAIILIFASDLIMIFAPEFKSDIFKFQACVAMTKMMSFYLFFVAIAALFMGALNSLKIFFIPSFASVIFNLITIIVMIISPPLLIKWGLPTVYSMSIGVFLGGIGQVIYQIPALRKTGFRFGMPVKIFNDTSLKVFKKLGPGLIGFSATQVNLLINTILATGSTVGAVSFLTYAFRVFQLPVGILSVSIGNSNLVYFSNAYKANLKNEANDLLIKSFHLNLLLIQLPLVFLFIFAPEIIQILFERGKFSVFHTEETSLCLRMYLLGLPFYSLYKLWVPVFYSIDLQKIPVRVSIATIIINIIFSILLTPLYGHSILALGTSVTMGLNSIILTWILLAKLNLSYHQIINKKFLKHILIYLLVIFWLMLIKKIPITSIGFSIDESMGLFINRIITITSMGLLSLVGYLLILFLLGEREEISFFISKMTKRFKSKK